MKTIFSKVGVLLFIMVMSAVCFTSCELFEKYSDVEKEDVEQEGGEEVSVTSGDFVDLGLSVKWASCNVGAENPWEYGNYYAWGEHEVKNVYDASNYKGPKDRQTICGSAWDAASCVLGFSWRMPTDAEFQELVDNCVCEVVVMNGVKGCKFTSEKNGNSIFIPLAGWKIEELFKCGEEGGYWAGTGGGKFGLLLSGSFAQVYDNWTSATGMSIRAVTDSAPEDIVEQPDQPGQSGTVGNASEQFVGYWLNTKTNQYGIDLFLNADGTGYATTRSWYWNGIGNYGYNSGYSSFYWGYNDATGELTTTYGSWSFSVTLINEFSMAATRLSGNSNVRTQSWGKASEFSAFKYFLARNVDGWINDDDEPFSFNGINIWDDEDGDSSTYGYTYDKKSGVLIVRNLFMPKKMVVSFSDENLGNVRLK